MLEIFLMNITQSVCNVAETSQFGLIQVGMSRATLRRHHDVATGTLMRRTCLGRCHDVSLTLNKTDQFETSQRRTNCYLNTTDEYEMSQRRGNWQLKGTDQLETSMAPNLRLVLTQCVIPRRNVTYLRRQNNALAST